MTAIGGSIESVSVNSREFAVTADADVSRGLGGDSNTVESNGNRTVRLIKVATPWILEGLVISIDDINDDQEFLQEVADGNGEVPVSITYASGVVYQASGIITDDLRYTNQNTAASLSMAGGGKLTKQ